jgi:hypothetical protein
MDNLSRPFNVIWPPCPAPFSKIFRFHFDPNHFNNSRRLVPHEGRIAIVTDAGRDAVDAGALLTSALPRGRRSRVVLTPRRWRQVPGKQKLLGGDGGKQARSPGRARNKLLKPLRAGMPGDPGATVVTNACAYYTSRTRLRVHRAPGIPRSPFGVAPRPLLGATFLDNSGAMCRGNTFGRRRPRKRAIQYSERPMIESRSCGVLDTPLSRSMTVGGRRTAVSYR